MKSKPPIALYLAFLGLSLALLGPKAAAEGDYRGETAAAAKSNVSAAGGYSQIKELSGRLLLDAFTEATKGIQTDRFLEVVGSTVPTTPSANHSRWYFNETAKQLCAIFDNGATGCLGAGTASTLSGITAGTGLTGGGTTGTVTISLSTPVANSSIDSSSITKQGNIFNGASQLTQLNNSSNLVLPSTLAQLGIGSAAQVAYGFGPSGTSGLYYVPGASNTVVLASSGVAVIAAMYNHPDSTDGAHNYTLRPFVSIGPGVLTSSMTQPGEALNVWASTDGGGAQPQVDIVSTNFGKGDARLLAQGSMADTPNTVIGYVAAYGSGHAGNYWTLGPAYPDSVAFISQAPRINMFELTTSSQTYFWNGNTTHAAYHFIHGSNPASDDITFLDGNITASTVTPTGIVGTNTNNNANVGNYGEYISSATSGSNGRRALTNATFVNMVQITLTAGDWDISGVCGATTNGATITDDRCAISINSGNTTTDQTLGDNDVYMYVQTSNIDTTGVIPTWRQSLSGGATVFLKLRGDFTGGPPQGYGRISARRAR